jgi:hypothetical protein
MLLIRKICIELKRPVFEVMRWPATELEYWSLFFSIGPKDKPIVVKKNAEQITAAESRNSFRRIFG